MPDLWTPVPELPHQAFIDRLHKAITSFAEANGIEKAVVEVVDQLLEIGIVS